MIRQEEFAKMVLHEFDEVKTQIAEGRADIALLRQQVNNHLIEVDKEQNKSLKVKLAVFGIITAVGTTLLNYYLV